MAIIHKPFRKAYFLLLACYALGVVFAGLFKKFKMTRLIIPGIVLTHLSYGIGSLYGLLSRRKTAQD